MKILLNFFPVYTKWFCGCKSHKPHHQMLPFFNLGLKCNTTRRGCGDRSPTLPQGEGAILHLRGMTPTGTADEPGLRGKVRTESHSSDSQNQNVGHCPEVYAAFRINVPAFFYHFFWRGIGERDFNQSKADNCAPLISMNSGNLASLFYN